MDNITRATVVGRDHVYWYDTSNRLTNVINGPDDASIIGLGYDVRGNVNNMNGNLFVFDHGNQGLKGTEAIKRQMSYQDIYAQSFVWKRNGDSGT